jgi:hypothetical protein
MIQQEHKGSGLGESLPNKNPLVLYLENLHLASAALTNGVSAEELFDKLSTNGWVGTLDDVKKWMSGTR